MTRALLVLVLLCLYSPASSQHHLYHSSYMSWANSEPKPKGCCDNQDCSPIADSDEREQGSTILVYVRGVGIAKGQASWCPIMPHHYLSKGNVPNASVSHYCITGHYGGQTPCEQLVCYQPRPRV